MSKIVAFNLTVNSSEYVEGLSITPDMLANPLDITAMTEAVTNWAEYNWEISSYWIVPNIMHALQFRNRSTEDHVIVVPLMDHSGPTGPTGDTEIITIHPVTL